MVPSHSVETSNDIDVDIDVDEMQSGSVYNGGYDVDSKPVALFWQAMKRWTVQERGNVLRFITGTSRVPLRWVSNHGTTFSPLKNGIPELVLFV